MIKNNINKNVLVLGIGHKARQGKDTSGNILKKINKNTYIFHFAEALYWEVTNPDRKAPIIIKMESNGLTYYKLLSDFDKLTYNVYPSSVVEKIHEIFTKRNIKEYVGMDEKDGEMLQAWGTNYRRALCDENYWVKKTVKSIKKIIDVQTSFCIVAVCDTRFINEVNAIRELNGYYIDVQRMNEDNTRFLAADRDNNHQSEIELDYIVPDYIIQAKSIQELENKWIELIPELRRKSGL